MSVEGGRREEGERDGEEGEGGGSGPRSRHVVNLGNLEPSGRRLRRRRRHLRQSWETCLEKDSDVRDRDCKYRLS